MTEQQTVGRAMAVKRLAAVLVVLALMAFLGQVPASLAGNDFGAGVVAYKRGDYATALKIFTRLANQGNAEAQYNLGQMYRMGRGVPRDYRETVKWYRLAAKQGYVRAQINLGIMHFKGIGVPLNYTNAVKWIRRAADQANPQAQAMLGIMYYLGRGVLKNHILAYMWYSLAASGGDAKAEKWRDGLERLITPAQLAEAQRLAAKWKPRKSGK
jgi:TPR repeat protein